MNTKYIGVSALALMSGIAYGQVPSTNDTSDGFLNTGMGTGALINVTPNKDGAGGDNTAVGSHALFTNKTGGGNAALGGYALYYNDEGSDNTAIGSAALAYNTAGVQNVAIGSSALNQQELGNGNTAIGYDTMAGTPYIGGNENTAVGAGALFSNSGNYNTATGAGALSTNYSGVDNTASGANALNRNSIGSWNTATGYRALYSNTKGSNNTVSGINALLHNTSGSNNIAMGNGAGSKLVTGSNNIEIGNAGTASDNNMIKIGTEGTQAKTFIAGIYNTSVSGHAVMISSTGQLGVVVSSERFKTAVAPMGTNTSKMEQLRPVTFTLKTDTKNTVQYGLIAEEVAKVYPELVVRDQNGRIDGVRYDELAPMLLNEMQQQQGKFAAQAAGIRALEKQVAELNNLNQEMRATLLKLQAKSDPVANH
jgi:hypothetical protein